MFLFMVAQSETSYFVCSDWSRLYFLFTQPGDQRAVTRLLCRFVVSDLRSETKGSRFESGC